jgi:hypothetical protein
VAQKHKDGFKRRKSFQNARPLKKKRKSRNFELGGKSELYKPISQVVYSTQVVLYPDVA